MLQKKLPNKTVVLFVHFVERKRRNILIARYLTKTIVNIASITPNSSVKK
jgi:hypothetical protein